MKRSIRASLTILAVVRIGTLLYSAFAPVSEQNLIRQLARGSLMLAVKPIRQIQVTSCGEAAITMAYNYANSANPIQESDVIVYATKMDYFEADRPPFTSP